jgi:hypothetical protein
MKKKLVYIWSFFIFITTFVCNSVFQVSVPKKLIEEKAALVLVMSDETGQQSIGKCRLDQMQQSNIVEQKDLEILNLDSTENIITMELLPEVSSVDQVVVCFELNAQIKVIRVMVIKECFLDDPFFEVVSFNVADEIAFEELYEGMNDAEVDALSQLAETINNSDLSSLSNENKGHWLEQYLAYAKLVAVMQYHNMKKVARKASSWWD